MPPHTIQYASPDTTRPNWKRRLRLLLAGAIGVPALVAAVLLEFRHDSIEVDAVTGSRRVRSSWPFGILTGGQVKASALEQRLNAMGATWTPDWRVLNVNSYSAVGLNVSRGCGLSPPIYSALAAMPAFAQSATDEEVRELVEVLQNGSATEQHDALNEAIEIAFRAHAADDAALATGGSTSPPP